MSKQRTEHDLLGEEILEDVYYGIHTLRATRNFNYNDKHVSLRLIYAMVQVKKAAAMAHKKLNDLSPLIADALIMACDLILAGKFDTSFVTHPLQGGAGTSAHMNVNEVIANVALETLGHPKGSYAIIDPIRDANLSQSTNDVYPTAMRIASIFALRELADEYAKLQASFIAKEQAFDDILRLGRTQYMDALPLTMGQTFSAYASVINRDRWRLYKSEERLRTINLGGTAIGTSLNAETKYVFLVTDMIQDVTGLGLSRSDNLIDATQNLDGFVEVSSLVKTAAVSMMKIANDFRLLASGPRGGLGELILPAHQVGSSIMPGKVNPVILESISQICMKIQGNDMVISQAVSLGVLELNAFGPLIIELLLESIELLTHAAKKFRTHVLDGLQVDEKRCLEWVLASNALITGLLPILGYDEASRIAKRAQTEHRNFQELLLEEGLFTQEELERYLNPRALVSPGIAKR